MFESFCCLSVTIPWCNNYPPKLYVMKTLERFRYRRHQTVSCASRLHWFQVQFVDAMDVTRHANVSVLRQTTAPAETYLNTRCEVTCCFIPEFFFFPFWSLSSPLYAAMHLRLPRWIWTSHTSQCHRKTSSTQCIYQSSHFVSIFGRNALKNQEERELAQESHLVEWASSMNVIDTFQINDVIAKY